MGSPWCHLSRRHQFIQFRLLFNKLWHYVQLSCFRKVEYANLYAPFFWVFDPEKRCIGDTYVSTGNRTEMNLHVVFFIDKNIWLSDHGSVTFIYGVLYLKLSVAAASDWWLSPLFFLVFLWPLVSGLCLTFRRVKICHKWARLDRTGPKTDFLGNLAVGSHFDHILINFVQFWSDFMTFGHILWLLVTFCSNLITFCC